MNEEARIKKRIQERLKNAPRYYHYCSVCAGYLCCMTTFVKYIVHFDCRNEPIRYYNSPDNPPPESPITR